MAYTKGPWVYRSNGSFFDIGPENDSKIIPVYPSACIGVSFSQEDNARLIAAAPELLEALEIFVGLVESDVVRATHQDRELLIDALVIANKAISNAKGK